MRFYIKGENLKPNLNLVLFKDITTDDRANDCANVVNNITANTSDEAVYGNVTYLSMDVYAIDKNGTYTNDKIGFGFLVQIQYEQIISGKNMLFTKNDFTFTMYNNVIDSSITPSGMSSPNPEVAEQDINSKKINITLNINNYNNDTDYFKAGKYYSDFVEYTLKKPKHGSVKCTIFDSAAIITPTLGFPAPIIPDHKITFKLKYHKK